MDGAVLSEKLNSKQLEQWAVCGSAGASLDQLQVRRRLAVLKCQSDCGDPSELDISERQAGSVLRRRV